MNGPKRSWKAWKKFRKAFHLVKPLFHPRVNMFLKLVWIKHVLLLVGKNATTKLAKMMHIFPIYYSLDSKVNKILFGHTEKKKTQSHRTENSKLTNTIIFFLPQSNQKVQVCKTMFLNTLGVVDIAIQIRTDQNTSFKDQRGKHPKKITSSKRSEANKQVATAAI